MGIARHRHLGLFAAAGLALALGGSYAAAGVGEDRSPEPERQPRRKRAQILFDPLPPRDTFTSDKPLTKRQRRRARGRKGNPQ